LLLESTHIDCQIGIAGVKQEGIQAPFMFDGTDRRRAQAHSDTLTKRFTLQRNSLQVWQKPPPRPIERVAYVITRLNTLAGKLATSRHNQNPIQISTRTPFLALIRRFLGHVGAFVKRPRVNPQG